MFLVTLYMDFLCLHGFSLWSLVFSQNMTVGGLARPNCPWVWLNVCMWPCKRLALYSCLTGSRLSMTLTKIRSLLKINEIINEVFVCSQSIPMRMFQHHEMFQHLCAWTAHTIMHPVEHDAYPQPVHFLLLLMVYNGKMFNFPCLRYELFGFLIVDTNKVLFWLMQNSVSFSPTPILLLSE